MIDVVFRIVSKFGLLQFVVSRDLERKEAFQKSFGKPLCTERF